MHAIARKANFYLALKSEKIHEPTAHGGGDVLLCYVDLKIDTNISEKHAIFSPGDGNSTFLQNNDIYLQVCLHSIITQNNVFRLEYFREILT